MRGGRGERCASALVAAGFLGAAVLLPARRPLRFDLCPLHRFTGLPCLTCGLTRSVCLFAHGEWSASVSMHPAGWLAFGFLVLAFAWLLGESVAGRDLATGFKRRLIELSFGIGGALSLLGWGARLAGVWPSS